MKTSAAVLTLDSVRHSTQMSPLPKDSAPAGDMDIEEMNLNYISIPIFQGVKKLKGLIGRQNKAAIN